MMFKLYWQPMVILMMLGMASTQTALSQDSHSKLERIQNHSLLWQYGWLSFFGGSILLQTATVSSGASTENEKFDARLSLVTSGSGLLSLLMNPLPSARWDYASLTGEDLGVMLKQTRSEVARRRGWVFQSTLIAEQLLVAGAIAFVDKRRQDALRRFALGMLVSEAFVFSTPLVLDERLAMNMGLTMDHERFLIALERNF